MSLFESAPAFAGETTKRSNELEVNDDSLPPMGENSDVEGLTKSLQPGDITVQSSKERESILYEPSLGGGMTAQSDSVADQESPKELIRSQAESNEPNKLDLHHTEGQRQEGSFDTTRKSQEAKNLHGSSHTLVHSPNMTEHIAEVQGKCDPKIDLKIKPEMTNIDLRMMKESKSTTEVASVNFDTAEFPSVSAAEESINAPPEEHLSLPSEKEEEIHRQRLKTARRKAALARAAKRNRTSHGNSVSDDDDTEVSESAGQSHPRKRARVSDSALKASSRYSAIELSSHDLPIEWTEPLAYFATMTDYTDDQRSWKQWKALPQRRVCNGAVWLSANCTGTPALRDHIEGPTVILRDLVALIQGGHEKIRLHHANYTSMGRANARQSIPKAKLYTEFALPRTLKAATEKEPFQKLTLDIIAYYLVEQIRAMIRRSSHFPSHLFASELHLFQFAPTIAFHLTMSGVCHDLADLLALFSDHDTMKALESLRETHHKHFGRALGSRRRTEGSSLSTASFLMSNEVSTEIESILEKIKTRLEELKKKRFGPDISTEPFVAEKNYARGDLIVRDVPVYLLPRSAAALRDRIYDYYDIPSFIVRSTEELAENDRESYQQVVATYTKDEIQYLDSSSAFFLDLTLTEAQESWLVSTERITEGIAPPRTEPALSRLQCLVSRASTIAPNSKLVVSFRADEKIDKAVPRCRGLISIQATTDIESNEPVNLDAKLRKLTWAEIADDDPEVSVSDQ